MDVAISAPESDFRFVESLLHHPQSCVVFSSGVMSWRSSPFCVSSRFRFALSSLPLLFVPSSKSSVVSSSMGCDFRDLEDVVGMSSSPGATTTEPGGLQSPAAVAAWRQLLSEAQALRHALSASASTKARAQREHSRQWGSKCDG